MYPPPHISLFLFLMFPLPRLSYPNYLPNFQPSLGRGIFEGTQFRISLFPISVLNKLKSEVKDEGFDSTWIALGSHIGGHGVRSVNTVVDTDKESQSWAAHQPTAAALDGTTSSIVARGSQSFPFHRETEWVRGNERPVVWCILILHLFLCFQILLGQNF